MFAGKRLATTIVLRQRRAMHSFYLIADAAIAGITVNGWKILGWSGNLVFGARFVIQWIASERARKSIIPVGFWECSAIGSILLLIYFAFYRHDSVGVLSALFPLPVYLRNLYFRYTHQHPKHPGTSRDRRTKPEPDGRYVRSRCPQARRRRWLCYFRSLFRFNSSKCPSGIGPRTHSNA